MSITRTKLSFEDHFTQIPNGWLRDPRLSRRARGLLAELMTHAIGWEITIESLVATGIEGRDAIRRAVGELVELGYLKQDRVRDEAGKLRGAHYELGSPDEPKSDLPTLDKPTSVKPYVGEPVDKEDQLFKEDHLKEHKPAADSSDEFIQWYMVYPKKEDKGHAKKAFKAARKKASLETLIDGAQRYAADKKDEPRKFLANPATWLNGERWEDEAPTQQAVVNGPWSKGFHQ